MRLYNKKIVVLEAKRLPHVLNEAQKQLLVYL